MTDDSKNMASAFAHLLHSFVLPKYHTGAQFHGHALDLAHSEGLLNRTKVTELADVVLSLASLGFGAARAAVRHGENNVWQVSQLHLKKVMAAVDMGEAVECNRGTCYAKSFSA
ncbi:hypothetical protein HBH53_072380 [Parastagonospora nodorum]|nr:hypothetical protein HBH53_072380 [Parastagonospora nodorum]